MMNKRFDELYESALQRFTRGGFLTGDYVKFIDNVLKDEWFESQASNVKDNIKKLAESDLNLRVSAVKTLRPSIQSGNVEMSGTEFNVDITQETAPGLYTSFATVPAKILVHKDYGVNLGPIPDSLKGKTPINIKPEEMADNVSNTQQKLSDDGKGKLVKGDRELLNKQIKIDHNTVDTKSAVKNSTYKYLPKKR
jgi:hypothetical protein